MTKTFNTKIGARDIELLTAIDRCPLTPAQLCRLSVTFDAPFSAEGNLRRRLRKLTDAGLVQSFTYAIAGDGRSPRYFKLTREGYRLVYGVNSSMPKRRYFQPISSGHHSHTYCLANTIVHLCVTAYRNSCEVLHFSRENSVKLVAEPFTLFPDCAFAIKRDDGRTFWFVVEFDNGTERVRSKQDVESIERKLRGYEAHQARFEKFDPERYLVLFITTRSAIRLQYIFEVAKQVLLQPKRRLFVGTSLAEFLRVDPFQVAVFEDHRGLKRTIISLKQTPQKLHSSRNSSKSITALTN
jgi:hypothetical protein